MQQARRPLPSRGGGRLSRAHLHAGAGDAVGRPPHAGQLPCLAERPPCAQARGCHRAEECGVGLVTFRHDGAHLAFAAPVLRRSGPPSPAEWQETLQFLGIDAANAADAAWIDNGPGWLGIRLASAAQVLALPPARAWPRRIDMGVVGTYPSGSLNASVAPWRYASGILSGPSLARQNTCLGRNGRVQVSQDANGQVWIGGATRTQVQGLLLGA